MSVGLGKKALECSFQSLECLEARKRQEKEVEVGFGWILGRFCQEVSASAAAAR